MGVLFRQITVAKAVTDFRSKTYVPPSQEDEKCDLLQIDKKSAIIPEFDRYLCQQCPQFFGSTDRLMAYTRYTFYIEQVMKYECEESSNCVIVARTPHNSVTTLAAEARVSDAFSELFLYMY